MSEPSHGASVKSRTLRIDEEIDAICSDFDARWRNGESPQLEEFLKRRELAATESLLCELLKIELEYRRKRGDTPTSDEYQKRFAEHRRQVADLFVESEDTRSYRSGKQRKGKKTTQIGNYRLLAKLGAGGMGTVYKALHTRLEKVVALKLLPVERVNSAEAVARFEREMKAVGRLNHPHIVQALDAGEFKGRHFLVMEYVEGKDLSSLSRRQGAIPVAEACELIRQATLGLQAAHERGMVHRDIKPANLFLAKQPAGPPVVKVLDLGLALLEQGQATQRQDLTSTGQIMGTIDYMAPEQASDIRNVDIRADVYSLGATLYKLLTRRAIYDGPDYDSVIAKLAALATVDAPSVQSHRPELPDELAAILHRMLSKDPTERYTTPAEVVDALTPFAEGADLARLLHGKESAATQPTAAEKDSVGTANDETARVRKPGKARSETNPTVDPEMSFPVFPQTAIADRVTGRSRQKTPKTKAFLANPKHRLMAGIGAAAAVTLAIVMAVIVFRVKTPEGTIELKLSQKAAAGAVVTVDGDKKITIKTGDSDEVFKIEADGKQHTLRIEHPDFVTYSKKFVAKSDGKQIFEVTLVPKVQAAGKKPAKAKPESGFVNIFDGKTLSGWDGDPRYWSVKDGAITGRSTKDNPAKQNTCIIWNGGTTRDFELRLQYRIVAEKDGIANSGIHYRSYRRVPGKSGRWILGGYQADIDARKMAFQGSLYSESERGALCKPGEATELIRNNGEFQVKHLRRLTGFDGAKTRIHKAGWNDYHIIARGFQFTHKVNGVTTAECYDKDAQNRRATGLLGLQLHRGVAMTVQFRNIRIKHFTNTAAAPNELTPAEKRDGWISLFNGRSLDGWKKSDEQRSGWKIEDGALVASGPLSHLFTESSFKDFHFKADVKTVPGSNSGIYFHTKYQASGFPKYGYESQINVTHRDPQKTGSLYNVAKVTKTTTKDNEWWIHEIIVRGRKVEVRINGRTVVDYSEPADKSGTVKLSGGVFALQAHGGPSVAYFRNIKVKPLLPATKVNIKWKPTPSQRAFFGAVRNLNAKQQVEAVRKKLQEVNSKFDGKLEYEIEDGKVVAVKMLTGEVTEIWPVKSLVHLRDLNCRGRRTEKELGLGRLSNLAPLEGMKLVSLNCAFNRITDLRPLQRMPLERLDLTKNPVSDLSPLKGLPLTSLGLRVTRVSDLAPLKGMRLAFLSCSASHVSDLTPLQGMPLKRAWVSIGLYDRVGHAVIASLPLVSVNGVSKVEFLQTAIERRKTIDAFATKSATLTAKQQVISVSEQLKAKNGYTEQVPLKIQIQGTNVSDATLLLRSPVADVSPLLGFPKLKRLTLLQGEFVDVSWVTKLPLEELNCSRGILLFNSRILRLVKTLKKINGKPAAEFWMQLVSKRQPSSRSAVWQPSPAQQAFFDTVRKLDAKQQVEAVRKKLLEENPKFDGKVEHGIKGGIVVSLNFLTNEISKIWPVRALVSLRSLECIGARSYQEFYRERRKGKLRSLAPLAGMSLTTLNCRYNPITDLSPLMGMRLKQLYVESTRIADLSPLKGMPLTHIRFSNTSVSDLSPLKGMSLEDLNCFGTLVTDLSPLQGMPLQWLSMSVTRVSDLSPLKGAKLTYLHCADTLAGDLTPLRKMPLERLAINTHMYDRTDHTVISSLPLVAINGTSKKVFQANEIKRRKAADAFAARHRRRAASQQVDAVLAKLKADYDYPGEIPLETRTENNAVVEATLVLNDSVGDITPLMAFPQLRRLTLLCGRRGLDISCLKQMSLDELNCSRSVLTFNERVLRSLRSLRKINGSRAADHWKRVDFRRRKTPKRTRPATFGWKLNASQRAFFDSVAALRPTEQAEAVARKLRELNPKFDGKIKSVILNGSVGELKFNSDEVTTIWPVRALRSLTSLDCSGTRLVAKTQLPTGKLADLSPLRGARLTHLRIDYTSVSDLSPLRGMPIEFLTFEGTAVSDLSSLKGMPLRHISHVPVLDAQTSLIAASLPLATVGKERLAALGTRIYSRRRAAEQFARRIARMDLESRPTAILKQLVKVNGPGQFGGFICKYGTNNSIAKGTITLRPKTHDLTPLLALTKLRKLSIEGNSPRLDLTILARLPLEELTCDDSLLKFNARALRGIKTLKTINQRPAAVYWALLDRATRIKGISRK